VANRGKVGGVDDMPANAGLADGIVVTPSHNPPSDGGFKYNPPHGGPADTDATKWIAARRTTTSGRAGRGQAHPVRAGPGRVTAYDFLGRYVDDLPNVVDIEAIRGAGVRIGADPLGGAERRLLGRDRRPHGLDLTVVNPLVDPTWRS
jgi:phosphoglucomutase